MAKLDEVLVEMKFLHEMVCGPRTPVSMCRAPFIDVSGEIGLRDLAANAEKNVAEGIVDATTGKLSDAMDTNSSCCRQRRC